MSAWHRLSVQLLSLPQWSSDVVLLHDDLLATGGSMAAALELVRKFGVKKVYINFIIELEFLNGRKAIGDDVEISSLMSC